MYSSKMDKIEEADPELYRYSLEQDLLLKQPSVQFLVGYCERGTEASEYIPDNH